jgi:pyruvate/2-oxoglutarate dehydrogenase complex dihydrolipoamide dehydrogenase (E3) component
MLTAPRMILATGSADTVPPIAGLAETGFLTHKELLDLDVLPDSLAVIGAGPVGVECAQIFAPFGVAVTLLSASPLPLPREDHEISRLLLERLRETGIQVETGVRVEQVERRSERKIVTFTDGRHLRQIEVTEILMATGHEPVVEGVGLERAGVEKGQLAVENALGATHCADYRVIPRATFCRPEVASVGLTEEQCRAQELSYRAHSLPMSHIKKSRLEGEPAGMAKLLFEPDTGQILGAHVMGARAGELIHEVAVLMQNRVPVGGIAGTIHAFPTFAEIWEAVALERE